MKKDNNIQNPNKFKKIVGAISFRNKKFFVCAFLKRAGGLTAGNVCLK